MSGVPHCSSRCVRTPQARAGTPLPGTSCAAVNRFGVSPRRPGTPRQCPSLTAQHTRHDLSRDRCHAAARVHV